MKPATSSIKNKCVIIYNAWFFSELLCWMMKESVDTALDVSGTLWHIDDVKEILSSWKAA